jgi:hypothetical protein
MKQPMTPDRSVDSTIGRRIDVVSLHHRRKTAHCRNGRQILTEHIEGSNKAQVIEPGNT